jgi:hypothetical protein
VGTSLHHHPIESFLASWEHLQNARTDNLDNIGQLLSHLSGMKKAMAIMKKLKASKFVACMTWVSCLYVRLQLVYWLVCIIVAAYIVYTAVLL